MSVAHRFGREGWSVALLSRSSERHPGYLQSLADAGIEAASFLVDAMEPDRLRTAVASVRAYFGRIDVGYYGPAVTMPLMDITALDGGGARDALSWVVPAVEFGALLLPEMRQRGSGGLLFAGGLSSVVPMPPLGGLALTAAALRNYALTLHAALAPEGIYAGTLTVGGLIENSDIHRTVTADGAQFGHITANTLDPDELADTLWRLYRDRTEAEAVINALT